MSLPFPIDLVEAFVSAAPGQILTDGVIFRLYYKSTILILAISAVILGRYQFFEISPLTCFLRNGSINVPRQTLNKHCWDDSVYYNDPNVHFGDYTDPHFQYFKWVFAFLCFQIFCFYLPHLLWKCLEGDRINGYISQIWIYQKSTRLMRILIEKNIMTDLVALSLDNDAVDPKFNYIYMAKYIFCKWLNTAALVGQLTLIFHFFGKIFFDYSYGIKGFQFFFTGHSDYLSMPEMFPTIIGCKFPMDKSVESVVCFIGINSVIRTIFVVLWFWYGLLMILTVVDIALWIGALCSQKIRARRLIAAARYSTFSVTTVGRRKIELLVSRSTFADWFVLDLLGNNFDHWKLGNTYKVLLYQVATLKQKRVDKTREIVI